MRTARRTLRGTKRVLRKVGNARARQAAVKQVRDLDWMASVLGALAATPDRTAKERARAVLDELDSLSKVLAGARPRLEAA